MATIVTVYDQRNDKISLNDMSYIRWVKVSEALARCGHKVDIATNEFYHEDYKGLIRPIDMGKNLRRVPLREINFSDYDIVKTLFHTGFKVLEKYGGLDHHFIIAKLGSVVGPEDMVGIYFYGDMREDLYKTQVKINKHAKYVTLLSKPAIHLWQDCFGKKRNVLLVPGGVDTVIPYNTKDPYPKEHKNRCIFAGNIYDSTSQPEANKTIISKLNQLGELLSNYDIRLFLLGPGDIGLLDNRYVTYLGATSYENTWQYLYHADVGIVVSAGPFMHNNESTKIYHYLRAGLPVVSEAGFPNDNVVRRSKLGFVVESENMKLMSKKIKQAAYKKWDKKIRMGINYVIKNHTWDKRVEIYDKLIRKSKFKIL